MQSADAEHVATTAAVVTMVLPVKGILKDIAVGSSTGAVDAHVVSNIDVGIETVNRQSLGKHKNAWHAERNFSQVCENIARCI